MSKVSPRFSAGRGFLRGNFLNIFFFASATSFSNRACSAIKLKLSADFADFLRFLGVYRLFRIGNRSSFNQSYKILNSV